MFLIRRQGVRTGLLEGFLRQGPGGGTGRRILLGAIAVRFAGDLLSGGSLQGNRLRRVSRPADCMSIGGFPIFLKAP